MLSDPILSVLLFSSVAAAASMIGAVPLWTRRDGIPTRWMGWANALAGGMMVGAAYVLSAREEEALAMAAGAVVGVLFIHWTHLAVGTDELDLNRVGREEPTYGYRVVLAGAFHAAWEGVAIGAAAAVDLSLGVFMALAIAVHNIPEATVLCAVLSGQGVRRRTGLGLVVAVNTPQILLAVAVLAVISAAPAARPWAVGFAVGALLDLTLVELLPHSYRQAGKSSIALVAAVAMGMVALVEGILR